MNKHYDVIVVGAGNGGLAAAATTAKNGLKTLLLERHNLPGGSASSFRRGRFEFEPSLHELAEVGTHPGEGTIRRMFEDFGTDIQWYHEENAFRAVLPGPDGFDATLPTGVEAFIAEMERQVPGCAGSVAAVFDLGAKALDALDYLAKGEPDPQVMAEQYTDFMRISSHTCREVLNALEMPQKAQDILMTYWCYLGATADQLDFLYYALMLLVYVAQKPAMPGMRSHELSLALEKCIRDNGGDVWYNTDVTRILVKDGRAYGVAVGGEELYAGHVICNAHMHQALGTMIDASEIPAPMLKLANARDIALNLFTVYLGMNRSAEELGIRDYSTFILSHGDSREQRAHCASLDSIGCPIMNCLNVVIPDSSPQGTCTLFFTTSFYEDTWRDVKPEDYHKLKNKVAAEIIEACEKTLGISIKPYIEEIEVAGPPTFARFLNSPHGTPYGYQLDMWDAIVPRTVCLPAEETIQGLRFCGACGERGDGYSSAYISGMNAGLRTVNDAKEGN